MSNSVQDIQTSINNLYKARTKYYPSSIKYMNITSEIRSLKNKQKGKY